MENKMQQEQCALLAAKFVSGLPKEIGKQLRGVELLVCETPELATQELRELMTGENGEPLEPIPADCKGVFIGEPLEREDDDDSEDTETVALPEGIIALVSANLKDADEVVLIILHEIGHALGMDEDEVKALGLGVSPSSTATGAPTDDSATGANG